MRVVSRYDELRGALEDTNVGGNSVGDRDRYLKDTIVKEIAETRRRLDKTIARNERLQDEICGLDKGVREAYDALELERLEIAGTLSDLRVEICNELTRIMTRAKTVEDLEKAHGKQGGEND